MLQDRWRSIDAQIEGLVETAKLYVQFLAVRSTDSYGVQKMIGKCCLAILEFINTFSSEFDASLPQSVRQRVSEFYKERLGLFNEASKGGEIAQAALTLLVALRSEISVLLSDRQAEVRSHTERAFLHLQRLIAADDTVRERWRAVYERGETACEALGAAHLLHHGIFAFKVNAEGARTDLVFAEPVELAAVGRGVDGLVLTEWKLVRPKDSASAMFATAMHQAKLYQETALAGVELRGYRYLVVVTKKRLSPPPDAVDGEVVYRHINIAVDPDTPAVAARRGTL